MTTKKLTQAEGNKKAHLDARGKRGMAKARRKENGRKAAELRLQGYSWREISEMCGYASSSAALKAYRTFDATQNQETTDEIRAIQRSRLEKIIKALSPKIEQGRERAAEVAIKALEREAKLLGLDADAGKENGAKQGITINIFPDPSDERAREFIKSIRGDKVLLPPIEGTLLSEEDSGADRR